MSVFDRIIAGQAPASFVHQDSVCVAFMDIHPLARGHVLVVPRTSRPLLAQLDPPTRAHLWEIANRIALAQQQALGSAAQHFLVNDGRDASQSVPHVHIHVIPRYSGDRFTTVLKMMRHIVGLMGAPPTEKHGQRGELDRQARDIAAAMSSRPFGWPTA
ncbi:MAG: HIT family protein [Panacagrimonas sp.]